MSALQMSGLIIEFETYSYIPNLSNRLVFDHLQYAKCIEILQVIKHWMVERPGNEANVQSLSGGSQNK